MSFEIQIFFRTVYGNTLAYPANEQGQQLARLMKVKSFNREQLAEIKALGFVVSQVHDPRVQL